MKYAFLSCLVLFISTHYLSAQSKLYPYRKGNLWGYCDENKKVIVEPVYNITYPHTDGMGVVIHYDEATKKYQYGFVNEKGKLAIPLKFASAGFFTKERAIVKNSERKYGVIDTKGKFIVEPLYKAIYLLSKSSVFKITNDRGKVGLFDLKGKKLIDFKYDDIDDASSTLHAILNTDIGGKQYCSWVDRNSGNEIPVKLAGAEEFAEGLAAAKDLQTSKYGYMNTEGQWVIPPAYWMAKPFNDSIALIANSQQNTRWMYLNTKGDTLFDKQGYSTAESFVEGVGLIDYKYISKDGTRFLPQYNFCYEFRGGLAEVRNTSKTSPEWYLIDKTGNILCKTDYSGGNFFYTSTGPIIEQSNWKYGVIDRTGKTIIEPKYNKLSFKNGMLCTSYQDKNYNDIITGYITEKGIECWDN